MVTDRAAIGFARPLDPPSPSSLGAVGSLSLLVLGMPALASRFPGQQCLEVRRGMKLSALNLTTQVWLTRCEIRDYGHLIWEVPMAADESPRWMSVPDAGRVFYGLSKNASYDACRRGEIVAVRVGRLLKVPVAAMEARVAQAGAVPARKLFKKRAPGEIRQKTPPKAQQCAA
jgi:hypothetical protein